MMRKEAQGMEISLMAMQRTLFATFLFLLAGISTGAIMARGEQVSSVQSAGTITAEQTEESQKAAWQKRISDARKQRADAEARKIQLEQKRDKLKYEWSAPGAKRTNDQIDQEIGQTNAEILQAQRDIDEATRLIEIVIPDEARKAGVPPGWVR